MYLPPPRRGTPEEPESFEVLEGHIRSRPSRAFGEPVWMLEPGIAVVFQERGSIISIGSYRPYLIFPDVSMAAIPLTPYQSDLADGLLQRPHPCGIPGDGAGIGTGGLIAVQWGLPRPTLHVTRPRRLTLKQPFYILEILEQCGRAHVQRHIT
jgi:hypothetical protein